MPSKSVSKSFRDEIIRAVTTVRSEVIEVIDKSLSDFGDTFEVEVTVQLGSGASAVTRPKRTQQTAFYAR